MAEIKLKIASVVIGSGEGGGGDVAPYYADLPDKPSINGETLSGDLTSEDLGLASESQAVPSGGTTGQVLAKKSNADNDVQWVNQESGGQGTTNYADLENKPKINNVTLSGNKTTAQLGLQPELVSGTNIKTINNQSIVGSGNITIEGGGTDDYTDLDNKPQINSVALSGNKSASDLGLATAAQGEKADTAVQQVTVGTTTTGNAGTNASVTNSGTSTAPVLDFTIPRGADAINPFKGWFTTDNIPATGKEGDYCNVSNTSVTPHTVTIYRWSTANNRFEDTGEVPDTATGDTFASSETLQEVAIDDSHLVNPVNTADPNKPVLAKAEDVIQLKAKLDGVTAQEIRVTQQPITGSYVKGADGTIETSTNTAYIEIELGNAKNVRFLGALFTSSSYTSGYAFGHYTDESDPTTWITDRSDVFDTGASTTGTKEYVLPVPKGAAYFRTTTATSVAPALAQNFYLYLQSGESVKEKLANKVEISKVPYTDYSQYCVWDSTKVIRGTNATLQSSTYGNAGYTDFIPVDDVKGLVCSNPFAKGSGSATFYGCYVYDSSKAMVRGVGNISNKNTSKWYVKQDGDAYVRFNLDEGAVISELTDDIIVVPSDISNYEALKISEGAVVGNQRVFVKVTGKNLCNPDNLTLQSGLYVSPTDGNIKYSQSATYVKGVTGFIRMGGKNVVCNKPRNTGSAGYACYDEDYHFTHGAQSSPAIYRDGDVYVRFSLDGTSDIQVEYGNNATDYEEYVEVIAFNEELLPKQESAKKSIYDDIALSIPNDIYITQGDEIYLYHKSIIEAVDQECAAIGVSDGSGTMEYPRYIKVSGSSVGNRNITIDLYANDTSSIIKKTVAIHTVAKPTSPSANVNILLIGASRQAGGETLGEMIRRLTGIGGTPAGLGLTNIRTVGQRHGDGVYSSIYHEARSGRQIHEVVVAGTYSYDIQLTGDDNTYGIEDTYSFTSSGGSWTLKITGSEPQDNVIHCSKVRGTGTFSEVFGNVSESNPGTLNKVSGDGSSTMSFISIDELNTNPFWHNGAIDFEYYASNCITPLTLPEKIDILIISRMVNDFGDRRTPQQVVSDYKTIVDAFHTYNADGKVIINTDPLPSPDGGLGLGSTTYGHPRSTFYCFAKLFWGVYDLSNDLFSSEDYSDFVIVSSANAEFDGWNLYPTSTIPTGLRGDKTEVVQNNGVHYTTIGKFAVADTLYHDVCKIINDING